MKEISLKKYCETHTQKEAAELMGRSQGAVWQMLQNNRDIYIVFADDGEVSVIERRKLEKTA